MFRRQDLVFSELRKSFNPALPFNCVGLSTTRFRTPDNGNLNRKLNIEEGGPLSIRYGENLSRYPGRSPAVLAEHHRQHPDSNTNKLTKPNPILDFLPHRRRRTCCERRRRVFKTICCDTRICLFPQTQRLPASVSLEGCQRKQGFGDPLRGSDQGRH